MGRIGCGGLVFSRSCATLCRQGLCARFVTSRSPWRLPRCIFKVNIQRTLQCLWDLCIRLVLAYSYIFTLSPSIALPTLSVHRFERYVLKNKCLLKNQSSSTYIPIITPKFASSVLQDATVSNLQNERSFDPSLNVKGPLRGLKRSRPFYELCRHLINRQVGNQLTKTRYLFVKLDYTVEADCNKIETSHYKYSNVVVYNIWKLKWYDYRNSCYT